jgi:predicted GNAT family acetyltransferase
MEPLDRPVWASLTTHHAPRSEGGEFARRFAPDINVFASSRDDSPEALRAFSELLKPGQRAYVLQVPRIAVPSTCVVVKEAGGVQLVATRSLVPEADATDVEVLRESDAPEMLALATLTEPGPFLTRTHTMGRFIGVRIDRRLAAMAGERMRFPGFTEVSGVCVHPDFRGRGLARRLSACVATNIETRGDTPFLHSWTTNTAAISLYESLGFRVRAEVNVTIFELAQ